MKKILFTFFIIAFFPSNLIAQEPAPSQSALLDAAVRLKKAHVEREWEACMTKIAFENRCRKLISLIHEQEKEVLARIQSGLRNPSVNAKRLSEESTACYNPSSNYSNLVDCWENLANRLDSAIQGEFLIKKDSICNKAGD